MCGIAGIFFKKHTQRDVGGALVQMLYGCQHRGQDSTGFAVYGQANRDELVLRFLVAGPTTADDSTQLIKQALEKHGAKVVDEETMARSYRVRVVYTGNVQAMAYALEDVAKVVSIGTSLEIIKDVGDAHEVDRLYQVRESYGTHGIGHVRLATESDVEPEAAHPFWATGFTDIAIVHNGQITNYWKMRRALESKGYEFHTDNDSELIAVFLAEQLNRGTSLHQVLEASIDELDGTFSFLVSTQDELGYAKDKLAAKPMVMMETNELVAIASEEVSLNRLFPGQTIETREPLPGTFFTWSK